MGFLGRLLDVLRIVVAAADDHHVFESAGDEQLAIADEAQVTGSQELAIVAIDVRAKHGCRFLGPVPIALANGWPLKSKSRRLRLLRKARSYRVAR